jgi:hypothetical protein
MEVGLSQIDSFVIRLLPFVSCVLYSFILLQRTPGTFSCLQQTERLETYQATAAGRYNASM